MFTETDTGNMPVLVDLKYGDIGALSVRTLEDAAKKYKIEILDDGGFPLILSMDIGFKIRLIAIL